MATRRGDYKAHRLHHDTGASEHMACAPAPTELRLVLPSQEHRAPYPPSHNPTPDEETVARL